MNPRNLHLRCFRHSAALCLIALFAASVLSCKKTIKAQVPTQRESNPAPQGEGVPESRDNSSADRLSQQEPAPNPMGVPASAPAPVWGTPGFAPALPTAALPPVQLAGLPPATASISQLGVRVVGQGYTDYRFAVIPGTLSCMSAPYSEWRPLNRPIDAPVSIPGKVKLCVVARSPNAMQAAPTEYNWVQVPPVEPVVNLANVPNDGHSQALNVYVNGLGIDNYHHVVLDGTMPCPPPPATVVGLSVKPIYAHITDNIPSFGPKRLCVIGITSDGQLGRRFAEHVWHQGAKPELQKSDPKPKQVRIDLTNINFESWHKICLFVSAGGGPFEKMGCNKQDTEKVRDFLEFDGSAGQCVNLEFRLEVFGFVKSCAGLDDVSTCEVSSMASPVRMTGRSNDRDFFVALSLDELTTANLENAKIETSPATSKNVEDKQREATEWLAKSPGRSWIRLFVEDQSDSAMRAFQSSGDAKATGIDFDDFVVDIRAIDVGFVIPGLGITCKEPG